ncbi:MAG TPA: hypothetical protein VJ978_12270, partial [Nitriliruptoraceae bacterium]|nr:hypothetical protein [Nitriliruptoraceae bacterium]
GMTMQVWLEHVCRIRGADARALLGCVDVLARMPSVLIGLCDRWLSWSQVQAICRAARRAPMARLGELDGLVSSAMLDMATFEPDAVVEDVWVWVDAIRPSRLEQAERAAARSEFVSLSPKLFGGGSMYGELGPVGFATVAEALDSGLAPPASPDDLDDLDDDAAAGLFASLDDQRRAHTRDHGTRMARRLVDLCERALSGTLPSTSDGAVPSGSPGRARPLLLATIDADALLDATRTPGWLLHTLVGGRMKVSANLLQQLVDERGADLRGIVLDDCGQVIGVGHKTDVPPHWLRQAIWTRDLAARDPDGACPVRRTDLDHIVAWPDGATDVTNLHPLGRRWHNLKTSRAWTVTRRDDGTTQWRHRRHGWTLRLAPARRSLTNPPPDPARRSLTDTRSPPVSPAPPQPAQPNQLALTGVD